MGRPCLLPPLRERGSERVSERASWTPVESTRCVFMIDVNGKNGPGKNKTVVPVKLLHNNSYSEAENTGIVSFYFEKQFVVCFSSSVCIEMHLTPRPPTEIIPFSWTAATAVTSCVCLCVCVTWGGATALLVTSQSVGGVDHDSTQLKKVWLPVGAPKGSIRL